MRKLSNVSLACIAAALYGAATLAAAQDQGTTSSQDRAGTSSQTTVDPRSTGTRTGGAEESQATGSGGQKAATDPRLASAAMSTKGFTDMAAQSSMAEIQAGKIAVSKSQDPAVQQFAERMIQDHTKANSELEQIASTKGLTPSKQLTGQHKMMIDDLSDKSGEAFDAAYMDHMVKSHQMAVSMFQMASKSDGVDPEISAFAKKTLPVLEEHLEMAKGLSAKQSGSANMKHDER